MVAALPRHVPSTSLDKEAEARRVTIIKTVVLAVLCLQNSGHALMTRYSQGILHEKYSSSEVVMASETIKLIFSTCMTVAEMTGPATESWGGVASKLFTLLRNSHRVIVLAALYMVGNMLSYYTLARVDASLYTVCQQLRVLTTAGFSGLLLGRQFSLTQWRAMVLLIIGCTLVASPTIESARGKGGGASGSEAVLGVCSLLTMVSISGFCSVYFEGILKDEKEKCSIWERNFQLSMFSIVLLVIYNFIERNNEMLSGRTSAEGQAALFEGWTINTVVICLLQSSGGLLVALTLKYADSIIKSLVTAGAIVLSTLFGFFLLGGVLNMYVGMGCAVTIIAIFNYMFVETA